MEMPEMLVDDSGNGERPSSANWWLMTPGCVNGSEEDAEAEFLEDPNQLVMESILQDVCNLDTKTTNLLSKFGEPLRSIVLANVERTSAYLRYRNQVGKKAEGHKERRGSASLINAGSMVMNKTSGSTSSGARHTVLLEEPEEMDMSPKSGKSPRRTVNRDTVVSSHSASSSRQPRLSTTDLVVEIEDDYDDHSPKYEAEATQAFLLETSMDDDDDDEGHVQVHHSVMRKLSTKRDTHPPQKQMPMPMNVADNQREQRRGANRRSKHRESTSLGKSRTRVSNVDLADQFPSTSGMSSPRSHLTYDAV